MSGEALRGDCGSPEEAPISTRGDQGELPGGSDTLGIAEGQLGLSSKKAQGEEEETA